MIKFKNRLTGTTMWVADERKDEYLAAGHKLAATCVKPTEEKPVEAEKTVEEVKPKRTRKKK